MSWAYWAPKSRMGITSSRCIPQYYHGGGFDSTVTPGSAIGLDWAERWIRATRTNRHPERASLGGISGRGDAHDSGPRSLGAKPHRDGGVAVPWCYISKSVEIPRISDLRLLRGRRRQVHDARGVDEHLPRAGDADELGVLQLPGVRAARAGVGGPVEEQ